MVGTYARVSHGSVLWPLLSHIYINDLFGKIKGVIMMKTLFFMHVAKIRNGSSKPKTWFTSAIGWFESNRMNLSSNEMLVFILRL